MELRQQGFSRTARALVLTACLLLCACDGSDDELDKLDEKNETVDVLYDKAFETFNRQAFKAATEKFEEVERQHPYSEWAARAQIMAAYSAYRGGQFDDALVILDRFVKLHPTHPSTPYAYYLTALTYYTQISDVGRDQKASERARAALKDVMERFPDSDYARDAGVKFELTEDHLAGKEMEIGRYYLKRMDYVAAVNRFKYVIDHYQTTSHTPEALHRLVESYLRLGVLTEAKKYAAVLGYNYPGSDWYGYSYAMLQGNLSPEEKKSVFDQYLKF
ncbi:MAG: outer membrane protein assembly factor BamD [Alphaproteobacteria bacterium]|nr:outer membrane protein assembly factor BamD [Alphaproteobacteria bacterium]